MPTDEPRYSIKVFDKNGVPYRNYTYSFLNQLFLSSKTAANFEVMALVEGLSFLGYFIYCNASKQPENYEKLINSKMRNNFSTVINCLRKAGIIDKETKKKLHNYRNKRNDVFHNWLQLKTPLNPKLSEYSYDEVLGELFKCGMEALHMIQKAITPTKENWEEYTLKFQDDINKKRAKQLKSR